MAGNLDRHVPSPPPAAPTSVPLIDLQRSYRQLCDELLPALESVCSSGRYVLGPECQQLEQAIASYCGARHGVACASGSDALLLALMAYGIGPGDEVILPTYTFFATASAVTRLGARPVMVDCDPDHYLMDIEQTRRAITSRTRAIIPVHLFGQAVEMAPLQALAAEHRLALIEDAAQAIGAEYRGTRAGSLGDIGCFSFYPTKNLGGFGDGGMLTTDRDGVAERLRVLRLHGMQPRYYHVTVGINSRLDTLQAAILLVRFGHLERWTSLRMQLAQRYDEMFAAAGIEGLIGLPSSLPERRHVWNQYVIRLPGGLRDELRRHLTERKIGTEIYYPVPLHLQQCFDYLGYCAGSLPVAERAARETLALPIFPELMPAEQDLVVQEIVSFVRAWHAAATPQVAVPAPKFLRQPSTRSTEST